MRHRGISGPAKKGLRIVPTLPSRVRSHFSPRDIRPDPVVHLGSLPEFWSCLPFLIEKSSRHAEQQAGAVHNSSVRLTACRVSKPPCRSRIPGIGPTPRNKPSKSLGKQSLGRVERHRDLLKGRVHLGPSDAGRLGLTRIDTCEVRQRGYSSSDTLQAPNRHLGSLMTMMPNSDDNILSRHFRRSTLPGGRPTSGCKCGRPLPPGTPEPQAGPET